MLCRLNATVCFLFVFGLIYGFAVSGQACTIFVLTQPGQTLFCNQEDAEPTDARIWFVPEIGNEELGTVRYGCAYVGFSNGWGQGGLNTQGLAFDWVAGFPAQWQRQAHHQSAFGNPAERMLESCANVQEAIAFFEQYWEPSFGYAKIMIADRSGASAIIGAKEGNLHIERYEASHGFGNGQAIVVEKLANDAEPTIQHGQSILKATLNDQWTRYSNIFDFNTGDIHIFFPDNQRAPLRLNLDEALKKGHHIVPFTVEADQ